MKQRYELRRLENDSDSVIIKGNSFNNENTEETQSKYKMSESNSRKIIEDNINQNQKIDQMN